MLYTQIAANAFKEISLNAGVLLKDFDPSNPPKTEAQKEKMRENIFIATGDGVTFSATPTYIDFGDGIDNVPANTKELKQLDYFDVKLSGTGRTVNADNCKRLVAAADVASGKVTPRTDIVPEDFFDLWWVGDYSDKHDVSNAGFVAIKVKNALSTGGFSLKSNDKNKNDFAFEFTGHYSLDNPDEAPFEIYIREGGATATGGATSGS